ncbi:MAG: hypothetical protein M1812_000305 [Candelaria pacifica]|nr:MAG: hypothetical protein M1812_000305 [Candelaria pacifica]
MCIEHYNRHACGHQIAILTEIKCKHANRRHKCGTITQITEAAAGDCEECKNNPVEERRRPRERESMGREGEGEGQRRGDMGGRERGFIGREGEGEGRSRALDDGRVGGRRDVGGRFGGMRAGGGLRSGASAGIGHRGESGHESRARGSVSGDRGGAPSLRGDRVASQHGSGVVGSEVNGARSTSGSSHRASAMPAESERENSGRRAGL